MQRRTPHLTDDELLLLDDPEALGGLREGEAKRHVAACASCAARRTRLAGRLAEVAAIWRESPDADEGPDAHVAAGQEWAHRSARARLCAALDVQAAHTATGWRRLAGALGPAAPAGAAALVALALVIALGVRDSAGPDDPERAATTQAPPDGPDEHRRDAEAIAVRLLPDRHLTPGAVRPVTTVETCKGDGPAGPAAAAGVPRQVFARYGIDYRRAPEYELDFLITPELGGAAEARNLWPQPYGATVWNAYVKDELERHLSRMVCGGALDLATAQRALATDWIEAYRRYFDTSRPRRDYRRYPLTVRDAEAVRGEIVEHRFLPPRRMAPVVADWTAFRGSAKRHRRL